ncbi:conserved Plasmodium protein, unknown function [Plasmodium relictum]|uniref:CID domain-containing protein n=1 Tax=Plasmodium relictum TaxID=85471 RepID=A0A1J1H9L0_PLARL|nr:conserved Plasmodium protein, unknown function [Plasmodium relictum]CRH00279.1 conserved Plasmodium protein, unknown function [Plasmodium relictum]
MKYEKKFWNDKSRKKNEKILKDEYHRNKKYNNDGYKSQNNKLNSTKSNYTSFSHNLKKKNYDDVKNNLSDKRNNKNEYSKSFKKTMRNQKLNMPCNNLKNNNSFHKEKYIRSSGEKSSKFNFYSNYNNNSDNYNNHINNNNYNNNSNDNNNSSNYYSNSSDNNNNDTNINLNEKSINSELNNLNKDLYNLIYCTSKNEENNSNMINMTSINNNVNNYNIQETNNMNMIINGGVSKSDNDLSNTSVTNKNDELIYQNYLKMQQYNNANNDYKTSFNNFYNSHNININNNMNTKNKNCNNTWPPNNENNNVLNKLADIRNIPFNNLDNGNSNFYVNDKTTMIINDLKKCLINNESNSHSKSNHMLNELTVDYAEKSFPNENSKNYLNNIVTTSKINNNKTLDEYNNNNNNNGFFTLNNENVHNYLQNKEEMQYNSTYNFISNDNKSLQESSISNESSVVDISEYGNRDKTICNGKIFPKSKIEESLRVLNTLQFDIERVCCYIKHFIDPPEQLFQIMTNVFLDKTVTINSKIAIFYVYNHLIQELRNNYKNDINIYNSIAEKGLQIFVIPVLRYILDEQVNIEIINKFYRCISIWNERNVYSKIVCEQLKSLQKNLHRNVDINLKHSSNQAHSLLSNEFSKFLPINFILKMPSINNEHKKALEDKILNALFNNLSKETLKSFDNNDIEEASKISDKVMRIFGQELILINSQMLELSSLISDNNENLIKLQNSMEKLKE